jgi:hypothetical protein
MFIEDQMENADARMSPVRNIRASGCDTRSRRMLLLRWRPKLV